VVGVGSAVVGVEPPAGDGVGSVFGGCGSLTGGVCCAGGVCSPDGV
jgi:hypothetical protein